MSEGEQKETWYDRCIELHRGGKLEESVHELEALSESFPEFGLAHLALAVFLGEMERWEESMDHMHRACEIEKDDPFYYTAFSSLAIKSGRRAEAEEALMQAQKTQLAEQLKKMEESPEENS